MITPHYMSDEEPEEHNGFKRFGVHSPHFRSEDIFSRDSIRHSSNLIVFFYTVLK